jgi:uncharacterized OB-fold protein
MSDDVGDAKPILPGLDLLNRDYWTGGAENRLLIAACACGRYLHPPLPRCPACGGRDVAPTAVSGRGRVAAFTVNRQAWLPGMRVPFVFAAVELEEQAELYVLTNIVGCPVEAVRPDLPVEVVFEAHEDVYLPMFRPRGDA